MLFILFVVLIAHCDIFCENEHPSIYSQACKNEKYMFKNHIGRVITLPTMLLFHSQAMIPLNYGKIQEDKTDYQTFGAYKQNSTVLQFVPCHRRRPDYTEDYIIGFKSETGAHYLMKRNSISLGLPDNPADIYADAFSDENLGLDERNDITRYHRNGRKNVNVEHLYPFDEKTVPDQVTMKRIEFPSTRDNIYEIRYVTDEVAVTYWSKYTESKIPASRGCIIQTLRVVLRMDGNMKESFGVFCRGRETIFERLRFFPTGKKHQFSQLVIFSNPSMIINGMCIFLFLFLLL